MINSEGERARMIDIVPSCQQTDVTCLEEWSARGDACLSNASLLHAFAGSVMQADQ